MSIQPSGAQPIQPAPRDRHPRRVRRAAAIAATALGLAAAGGGAITVGADQAEAVTNAAPTASAPAVVRLDFFRVSDGASVGTCSGLTLTRHWVLTSAHCLRGRSVSTSRVQVSRTIAPSVNEVVYPTGPARFHNHPDYDERLGTIDRGNDVGLVQLQGDGQRAFTAGRIYDGPTRGDGWKDSRATVAVHGYGRPGVPGSSTCAATGSGTKRFGWITLTGDTVDAGTFGTGEPLAVEGHETNQRICEGDSGGTWSIDGPAGPLAFALTSGPGARFHDLTSPWATLIRPKLAWAQQQGTAKGQPFTCTTRTQYALQYLTCAEPTPPRPPVADPGPGTLDPGTTPRAPGAALPGGTGRVAQG